MNDHYPRRVWRETASQFDWGYKKLRIDTIGLLGLILSLFLNNSPISFISFEVFFISVVWAIGSIVATVFFQPTFYQLIKRTLYKVRILIWGNNFS